MSLPETASLPTRDFQQRKKMPMASKSMSCTLILILFAGISLFQGTSLSQEQALPFTRLGLSREAVEIRQSLAARKYRLAAHLLAKANRDDAGNRAMAVGLDAATKQMVDPITLMTSTHDFHELTGAFIPNGNQDPLDYFDDVLKTFIEISPESAPHLADAICLGLASQLDNSITENAPIAISDSILFSTSKHSKTWGLGQGRQFAVIQAESAEREKIVLAREMLNVHVGRQAKHFLIAGSWRPVKMLATKIDPDSKERWDPVYRDLAVKCAKKGRFSSGVMIASFGTKDGLNASWSYLNAIATAYKESDDGDAISRLKIAFAYTCDVHRAAERPLPIGKDEDFDAALNFLRKVGKPHETKHMLEIAGLEATP
jgi:hypothetical protein